MLAQAFLEAEKQMLDIRRWLNPKHYNRLWNVGPPGLLFSVSVVHGVHYLEKLFRLRGFSLEGPWFWALITLVVLDATALLFWVLFSLPPKDRGRKLSKKGIYSFIRHPIYTVIIYHMTVLYALSWGSFLLLFFLPLHHAIWTKLVQKEVEYLVGIF